MIFNISQMHVFYFYVLLLKQKHLMKFFPQDPEGFLNFHVTMNFSEEINQWKQDKKSYNTKVFIKSSTGVKAVSVH